MRWRGGDLVASVVLGSSETCGPDPGAWSRASGAMLRVGHSSTNGLRAGAGCWGMVRRELGGLLNLSYGVPAWEAGPPW